MPSKCTFTQGLLQYRGGCDFQSHQVRSAADAFFRAGTGQPARSLRSPLDLNDPDRHHHLSQFPDALLPGYPNGLQLQQADHSCLPGSSLSKQIYGIAFGSPYIIAIMIKVFGGLASVVDVGVF